MSVILAQESGTKMHPVAVLAIVVVVIVFVACCTDTVFGPAMVYGHATSTNDCSAAVALTKTTMVDMEAVATAALEHG